MKLTTKLILTASLVAALSLSVSVPISYAAPSPTSDETIEVSDRYEGDSNTTRALGSTGDRIKEVSGDRGATLNKINDYATSIYNIIKLQKWREAELYLALLQNTFQQLKNEMKISNAELAQLYSNITALRSSVAAKNHQAMCDANQMTLITAKLAKHFDPQIPIEVAMLDYYGRELEIWTATENTTKLRAVSGKIRQTWEALRPSIHSHSGSTQLENFEDTLIALVEKASSPTEYSLLATPILGEVKNLRRFFQV
ncbi:hypothetical protein C7Y66_04350 [Chroococcidiopsis sp. CCALA 051]|uniref:hypothetical protein n=1 Tax=Chroococcidiopsis sp. CCALA 051 TaxID=869949 RepID=UPI000D0CEC1E|nr:hypothetical protein [Chroococcidiopsis sp. CCALA 051]PSM50388.1 hypothetical protein C7Y66_04350 [Chroococcidiopsis sp. CCALA 051]